MNWKLASAFSTGAVLASGIVYFSVRPVDDRRAERPKPMAELKTAAPVAAPIQAPRAEPGPTPAPTAAPVVAARIPVREKPSPMPPPVRREKPIEVAKPAEVAKLQPPPVPHTEPQQPLPAAPQVANPESAPQSEVAAPPPAPAPAAAQAPAERVPLEKVPVENVSLPASIAGARVPNTVTLMAGTLLPVRIGETLSSARNQTGDTFLATLTQPLVIDGFIIAERGARLEGRVVDATQAGRVTGSSHLGITIVRLATSDGQNIRIRTEPFVKDATSSAGTDAAKIGAGAAIGAAIGALAGGGKGAAIGAGAGAAVGAGDVLLTRARAAEIKVETRVSFRVQEPVTITERLD